MDRVYDENNVFVSFAVVNKVGFFALASYLNRVQKGPNQVTVQAFVTNLNATAMHMNLEVAVPRYCLLSIECKRPSKLVNSGDTADYVLAISRRTREDVRRAFLSLLILQVRPFRFKFRVSNPLDQTEMFLKPLIVDDVPYPSCQKLA